MSRVSWILLLMPVAIVVGCFDAGSAPAGILECASGPDCPAPLVCADGRCEDGALACVQIDAVRTATPVDDGAACGTDGADICIAGSCVAPRCGDGIVTLVRGETCDGDVTCRADCTRCGDGVIDGTAAEGCDDGALNSDVDPGACRTDCVRARCGDGVRDPGEGCDDGDDNSDGAPDACRTDCRRSRCGDGVIDEGEGCDDGPDNSDAAAGACRTTCVTPVCGDGVVDDGEGCDDGPANSDVQSGACRFTCVPARCGDATLDAGEACDDGDDNSDIGPDACRSDCRTARCGDLVVDPGEACDEGADNSDIRADACRTDCALSRCGDGVVDIDEPCDDGTANSDVRPAACRTTCELPRCGDGVRDPGEGCDLGADNSDSAVDGCRTTCVPAGCGDGVVDGGERCDDGLTNSDIEADACRQTCVPASCGDGIIDSGETCDEGAANSDIRIDACRADCRPARCGDGALDTGEDCDAGAANSDLEADACRPTCRRAACGDGVVDRGEVCDDGGQPAGGCRGDCRKVEVCGDGVIDASEACDDGNTNAIDGCDACARMDFVATPLLGPGADNRPPQETPIAQPGGVAVGPDGVVVWSELLGNTVKQLRDGAISVVAGWGTAGFFGNRFRAVAAGTPSPGQLAIGPTGEVAIVDRANHQVRVIAVDGIIRAAAGQGTAGSAGDGGQAIFATLNAPVAVAFDGRGTLFIAEAEGFRVRRVDVDGTITTVAGTGVDGVAGDGGPATGAPVNPFCLAYDRRRGRLFIGDLVNRRVRVVEPDGVIRRFAGTGAAGTGGDGGSATAAAVTPRGLAVDLEGNLFIADDGHRIRRVDTAGVITTVVGTGVAGGAGDGGQAIAAQLSQPIGVAVDDGGRLFIAENNRPRIRIVDEAGIIQTLVGSGAFGDIRARATETLVFSPADARFDAAGRAVFPHAADRRVLRREPDGSLRVLGGDGSAVFVDGAPATATGLPGLTSVAIDADGSVLVASQILQRVVRLRTDGIAETIAGTGVAGFAGDGGDARSAQLNRPLYIDVDAAGRVYITDAGNERIRRVDVDGVITTVAGTGVSDFSGDGGPATAAALRQIFSARAHPSIDGAFVIADVGNQRLRAVGADGVIRTIAGTGARAFSADGGLATASALTDPTALAFDEAARVVFVDFATQRLRRIEDDGTLRTVVGTGAPGFSGDGGPASAARLNGPRGIDIDTVGRVLWTEQTNNAIRLRGTDDVVHTVVGRVQPTMSGVGGSARLVDPRQVARLGNGRVVIATGQTGRLALLRPDGDAVDTLLGYDATQRPAAAAKAAEFVFGLAAGIAVDGATVFVANGVNGVIRRLTLDDADPGVSTVTTLPDSDLRSPSGLAFDDATGTLLVVDKGDHCVRRVDPVSGVAEPFIGRCGALGDGGDGDALDVTLDGPTMIYRTPEGVIYFVDAGNHRVRRVVDGIVQTVVGVGAQGGTVTGRAGDTALDGPRDVFVDGDGNLFVSTDGGVVLVADIDGDGLASADDLALPIFVGDSGRLGETACPGPLFDVEGGLAVVDRCSGGVNVLRPRPLP